MTLITVIITALASNNQALIPCLAPPPGASKSVTDCVSTACNTYQDSYNACQTQACKNIAWLQHGLDVADCLRTMGGSDIVSDPWITLWYSGDEYGYVINEPAPEGSFTFLF